MMAKGLSQKPIPTGQSSLWLFKRRCCWLWCELSDEAVDAVATDEATDEASWAAQQDDDDRRSAVVATNVSSCLWNLNKLIVNWYDMIDLEIPVLTGTALLYSTLFDLDVDVDQQSCSTEASN
jgi:hypothetical protein